MNNGMKMIMATILVATVIAGALFMSGCVGPTEEEVTKVTAMMPYILSSEWAAFYTAIDEGYYADEGLDVSLEYTDRAGLEVAKQLVAGNVMFGYTGDDNLITARSKGTPVIGVYHNIQENRFSIITKKGSGINKPEDLIGKKIAVVGPLSSPDLAAKAILMKAGVDYNKVDFIPVGGGTVPALIQDKVDAIGGYIIFEIILEKQGIPMDIWYAQDYSSLLSGSSIIVTEETLIDKPELVEKFIRATDKGYKYATEHPEEAVDIYINNFNPGADRDIELAYWERLANEAINPNKYPLGQFNHTRFVMTQDTLYDIGVIDKKTDVNTMYTDDILKSLET